MKRIKLLIVDDEERSLVRYKNYIEEYQGGMTIAATAMNYQEAVNAFDNNRIDCIFTDIVIPGGDGLQFIEYVRGKNWQGPFVVISGYDKFSYAQRAIKLGVTDYLLKPIFKNEYFKMLDKIRLSMGETSPVENKYRDPSLPVFITKAMDYVEHNYDGEIQLSDVASRAGVSTAHLSSSFTKYLGISFVDFVRYYRIQVVISLLQSSPVNCSLNDIAEKTGFCDASYLNHCFKKQMGITPRKYQLEYYAQTRQEGDAQEK